MPQPPEPQNEPAEQTAPPSPRHAQGADQEVCSQLMRQVQEEVRELAEGSDIPTPIRQMLFHIKAHFVDPNLDIDTVVAAATGTPRERHQLAMQFNQSLGVPPAWFIDGTRFTLARRLLELDGWSLESAAQCAGFHDVDTLFTSAQRRLLDGLPEIGLRVDTKVDPIVEVEGFLQTARAATAEPAEHAWIVALAERAEAARESRHPAE